MTEPLPSQDLDLLLSADLDGDFDAAAADLGLAPDTARARLRATPGAENRRRDLERARAALAVEPLDAATRAALVAAAVRRGPGDELVRRRGTRSRTWLAGGAAAAAAVAVLAVGGLLVSRGSNDGGDDGRATAAADADMRADAETQADEGAGGPADEDLQQRAAEGSPLEFGEVADPERLRARVEVALAAGTELDERAGDAGAFDAPDATSSDAALLVPEACVARHAEAFGVEAPPLVRGPGTFEGVPVEVLVFAPAGGAPGDVVVLVLGPDCTLRVSQSLRAAG